MGILTNPNEPEFRRALRELGAPDWFPQDAPRHIASVTSEQNEDGVWLSKLVCPICGWEKHFVSGEKVSMKTINVGDEWAHHSGSTAPEIFQITGIKVNPANDQIDDDTLKPFEDFLRGVE